MILLVINVKNNMDVSTNIINKDIDVSYRWLLLMILLTMIFRLIREY
jgi:hypothetical protein